VNEEFDIGKETFANYTMINERIFVRLRKGWVKDSTTTTGGRPYYKRKYSCSKKTDKVVKNE
jgi:hypothetical protein